MSEMPIQNPYLPANHQDAGNEPTYWDDSNSEELKKENEKRNKLIRIPRKPRFFRGIKNLKKK